MEDILRIIGKIKWPDEEHIAVLEGISGKYQDTALNMISAFNYGVMVGKREERARKQEGC